MDQAALLKRLREKALKGLKLSEEGISTIEIFALVRDLNYLHLCLLRELAAMKCQLPLETISILLEIDPLSDQTVLEKGKALENHSKGDLLQMAGIHPLICLHRLPSSQDMLSLKPPLRIQDRKDRIISLLLNHIRSLKEK